jgi:predicted alpha/beta-hydrolase family hydrolase
LLVRPKTARWFYVLAHGAGAGMRHAFMIDLAEALADRDVATLRWEFPYMRNGGGFRTDKPAVAERAVREAWNASAVHAGDLPRFAGGKSFGGRMTSRAHAAEPLAELRGIAFLGFPLHPPEKRGIERAEHLAEATGPLLFLQGDRDDLAELALLRPVVKNLGGRAKLVVIAEADHGFGVLVRSGRTHAEVIQQLAMLLATWMEKTAAKKLLAKPALAKSAKPESAKPAKRGRTKSRPRS